MRKAFKFITDKEGKDKKKSKDIDTCIKKYFETSASNITIPFKYFSFDEGKVPLKKPWTAAFWRRFSLSHNSSQTTLSSFVSYDCEIEHFPAFVVQDNEKKINYLVEVVEEYMNSSNIKVFT